MSEYTITELAELSAVNRRNIHFYVQQGLLPPPAGAGLGARYSDDHLLRLRAIPVLRSRGLRLDEIRERLAGISGSELAALLAQPTPAIPMPEPLPPIRPWPRAQPVMRYTLGPGIELLVDASVDRILQGHLPELAQSVQQILQRQADSHRNGGES
jgi:Ca-activated chloride channel family protein